MIDEPTVLTLSGDARVRVEPVSPEAIQLAQRRAAPLAERPAPPTRPPEHVFGADPDDPAEAIVMTDLKDIEDFREDPRYEAWATAITEYRDALGVWSGKRMLAQERVIIAQGVWPLNGAGEDLGEAAMRERLELIGVEVPEAAGELRVVYVRTWLFRTQVDRIKVMGAVGDLTAVTEEDVREALEGFRTTTGWTAYLGGAGGAGAGPGGEPGVRGPERGGGLRVRRAVPARGADPVAAGDRDRVGPGQHPDRAGHPRVVEEA